MFGLTPNQFLVIAFSALFFITCRVGTFVLLWIGNRIPQEPRTRRMVYVFSILWELWFLIWSIVVLLGVGTLFPEYKSSTWLMRFIIGYSVSTLAWYVALLLFFIGKSRPKTTAKIAPAPNGN